MPLSKLLNNSADVGNGQVLESLLNGQYRVLFNGRQTLATSQAGQLPLGAQVTLARTAAGLVVISAGPQSANTMLEVTING